MKNVDKNLKFAFIAISMLFLSVMPVWAQGNNTPVRITISGIEGFNGWDGIIGLSTSNDISNYNAGMAAGSVDRITAGSATFLLMDREDRPFTKAGRYYIFLIFEDIHTDRAFASFTQHNITNGHQYIAFNFDVFHEIDL